jgi:hypothetical protein
MRQDLDCMLGGEETQISVLNCFNSHNCCMRSSIVMVQTNSIYQHSSAFFVNGRFKLLLKHSTVLCTVDDLSMILVLLKDGPLNSQNTINITLREEATL